MPVIIDDMVTPPSYTLSDNACDLQDTSQGQVQKQKEPTITPCRRIDNSKAEGRGPFGPIARLSSNSIIRCTSHKRLCSRCYLAKQAKSSVMIPNPGLGGRTYKPAPHPRRYRPLAPHSCLPCPPLALRIARSETAEQTNLRDHLPRSTDVLL